MFIGEKNKLILKTLRKQENLDELLRGIDDTFERAWNLAIWVRRQWPHSQPHVDIPLDAITQLACIRNHLSGGWCGNYVSVFIQCALSMDIEARSVGITSGSDWHNVVEVWCPESKRWSLIDVDYSHYYIDEDANALNAMEMCRHKKRIGSDDYSKDVKMVTISYTIEVPPEILNYFRDFEIHMRNDYASRCATPWPDGCIEKMPGKDIKANANKYYGKPWW